MNTKNRAAVSAFLFSIFTVLAAGCGAPGTKLSPQPSAQQPADFPQSAVDYFKAMDGGIALDEDEVKGRNTWLIWTAGNDGFWDYMSRYSYGNIDLLKILDSRKRGYRFRYSGLMNEPGFKQAAKPDANGLWVDEPDGTEDPYYATNYREQFPKDAFLKVYGRSSGVMGLRLFPNPAFNGEAKRKWDPVRYYTDPGYYRDPNLVRPYRVGMACGFCHIGPHPTKPPLDPERPKWENLSSNIGSQYFWVSRIFTFDQKEDSFVYQLLNSNPPGTLDTSFIATDNINAPRTMNAIYQVGPRLAVAHEERLAGANLLIPGTTPVMRVPHVLKDGSDSIGIIAALSRVYLNIGEFHEEWIKHFKPLIGGKKQTPIEIAVAQENSPHWRASAERVGNLAKFFLKSATPHYLKDAPGGAHYLNQDPASLTRGKQVFAEQCADCHSSKQPTPPAGVKVDSPEYGAWTHTPDYGQRMVAIVMQPDFLNDNFLSTDRRYPVSKIGTNACSPLATNGLRGHVWDNFTSETYKNLPAVGKITVHHPLTGAPYQYDMPGGGRGYHRVPSLVSLWATAPFFHNNALGKFTGDPSVSGRMAAFDDAITKLLWPEKRLGFGSVYRTSAESWLVVDEVYLPSLLVKLLRAKGAIEPGERELRLGPIPKGTPINLIANINNELSFEPRRIHDLVEVLFKVKRTLKRIRAEHLDSTQSTELLKTLVPDLLEVNKCPDFVTDRGHTFGSTLSDRDKQSLIAFLKTF